MNDNWRIYRSHHHPLSVFCHQAGLWHPFVPYLFSTLMKIKYNAVLILLYTNWSSLQFTIPQLFWNDITPNLKIGLQLLCHYSYLFIYLCISEIMKLWKINKDRYTIRLFSIHADRYSQQFINKQNKTQQEHSNKSIVTSSTLSSHNPI